MTRIALWTGLFLVPGLFACTTPTPEPRVVTRDVLVPVAKACVPQNLAPEPDWRVTGDTIRRAPTSEDRTTQLAIGFKERDDRLRAVEPVIAGCR